MKSKEQRRQEADVRAEKWRALTPQQKLEVLDAKRAAGLGGQRKERAKIYAANPELLPVVKVLKVEAKPVLKPAEKQNKNLNLKSGRVILK